jgi:hypothetical protein
MAGDKAEYVTALSDLKDGQLGVAAEHADNVDGQPPPTQEELRAVRRKIDWRVMPIMVGTYGLQFYGRAPCSKYFLDCEF